jgi:hypothetical protein
MPRGLKELCLTSRGESSPTFLGYNVPDNTRGYMSSRTGTRRPKLLATVILKPTVFELESTCNDVLAPGEISHRQGISLASHLRLWNGSRTSSQRSHERIRAPFISGNIDRWSF